MKTLISALFVLSMFRLSAQEIAGKVLDDKKEPMINANVQVFQNEILTGSNVTDFDGNYVIKPLDSGLYNVKVFYTGFDTILVTNVVVTPGNRTTQNCRLPKVNGVAKCVNIAYKRPLVYRDWIESVLIKAEIAKICCGWIDPSGVIDNNIHYNNLIDILPVRNTDTTGVDVVGCPCANFEVWWGANYVLTKEQIDHMPSTTIDDLLTIFPGVTQARRGDPISIHGYRGTTYYIDGVRQ
jgi:hypothetical protein